MLLEKLCNAFGPSGCEKEVRELIKAEITPYADETYTDTMGNLFAKKYGKKHDKTVMLSCHTDEVGFIISGITKEGYLQFKTVGGIDTRVIISKKVVIGDNKIKGIIGIKAIHLTTKQERESVPKSHDLYIDIGAKDKEDAEKHIKLGDYATFDTVYQKLGNSSIKAKAIDDRAGCYILSKLIKETPLYDTIFCFCVQEEVGLRGAKIASERINPDICLVVEATTCSDVSDVDDHLTVTKMNEGVAVSFMDRSTIVDEVYSKWLYNLGINNNIKVQYKKMVAGGNDAGAIHLANGGIKTASLSVPCRYLHSPVSVASLNDIDAAYMLCKKFLEKTDEIL